MSESRRNVDGRWVSKTAGKRGGYESSSKSVTRLAPPPAGPAPGAKLPKAARPAASRAQ